MTGWCASCGRLVEFTQGRCPSCGRSPGSGASERFFVSGSGGRGKVGAELPVDLVLLDRFRVLERCGSGRTGTVYKMFDLLRSETVAVKVPPYVVDSAQASASRIVHEMRLFDRVHDHSHVLKVFDLHVVQWGGGNLLLLPMEYADGGDLRVWMESHLNDLLARCQEGIVLVRQLCAGVVELERVGIIPLDIKPENALLIGGMVKVADLDSSLLDGIYPVITGCDGKLPPRMLGTPGYMSPEQLAAKHIDEVDIRASIFAIGVILFEMLDPQGCRPFGVHTGAQRGTPARGANPMLPQLDESLTAIVRRCLDPRRERRFSSAAELLDALLGLEGMGTLPAIRSAEPEVRELAAPLPPGALDNVHRALTERRYADAQWLCQRILILVPHHEEAADVLRKLEQRYAAAREIYATVTREMNSMPIGTLAVLVLDAVEIYPEHPDGIIAQHRLLDKAARYSQNAAYGCEAMNAGSWHDAFQCLGHADQLNPHEPVLSTLTQNLRQLVDARKGGRQAIDAAIATGDFARAFRLAAVLDHDVAELEAGIIRRKPGVGP